MTILPKKTCDYCDRPVERVVCFGLSASMVYLCAQCLHHALTKLQAERDKAPVGQEPVWRFDPARGGHVCVSPA